jgi:hypothetical protein
LELARDHLLTAADIDDSDVTLWFTIAGKFFLLPPRIQQAFMCCYRRRQERIWMELFSFIML